MDLNLSKLREMVKEGSLVCCSPWGHKESDTTEQLTNNNKGIIIVFQTLSHVLLFGIPWTVAPAHAGDMGSVPRSERFPEEGNVNPIQYSCLGKSQGQRS